MGNARAAPATLPAGRRVYAIGDVHGCLDRLVALHERIRRDLAERPVADPVLVHLGDYVDRGPDSAGVVRRLMTDGVPGVHRVDLLGNHEDMLLRAVDTAEPEALAHWLGNGGLAALRSWGVTTLPAPDALGGLIPPDHLAFLRGLPLYHREGGYLFVHAGLRPGLPLERQSRDDLVWIREPFLSWSGGFGAVVVHGHTPMAAPVVKRNRIGVDTGAVLGGPLTCLVLEASRLEFFST